MFLQGPGHGRAVARKANAFLYCACFHCRVLKANPADIEPYEMACFVWTISTLCRTAAVVPLPLLVFSHISQFLQMTYELHMRSTCTKHVSLLVQCLFPLIKEIILHSWTCQDIHGSSQVNGKLFHWMTSPDEFVTYTVRYSPTVSVNLDLTLISWRRTSSLRVLKKF